MECRAQFERFDSFRIPLSHVDSHEHVHMISAVFRAILPILRERRVPLRVVEPFKWHSAGPLKACKQYLLVRSARKIREAYSVTPNTHLVSIHDLPGAPVTAATYRRLLGQGELPEPPDPDTCKSNKSHKSDKSGKSGKKSKKSKKSGK